MQDGNNNVTPNNGNQTVTSEGIKVVQTDVGAKDGQNKCPKCGSTEITTNINIFIRNIIISFITHINFSTIS